MNPEQQNPNDQTVNPNPAQTPPPAAPQPVAAPNAPTVAHTEMVIQPPTPSPATAVNPAPVDPTPVVAPVAAQPIPAIPEPTAPSAAVQAALQSNDFQSAPPQTFVSGGDDTISNVDSQPSTTSDDFEYISNPFLNAVRGLILILKNNPVSSLLAGLVGALLYLVTLTLSFVLSIATGGPVIALLGFVATGAGFGISVGAYYLIAGASAREETISTADAYKGSAKRFISLLALSVLSFIAITIGLILLIIPGVIIAARLSLAPLILFEEKVNAIEAMKRSFSLTKGHVNEMLGAMVAGMFLGGTYSLLFGATSVSPLIGRYHDLLKLEESGAEKPKVHWLNFSYIIALLLIGGTFGALVATTYAGIHKTSQINSFESSNGSYQLESDSSSSFPSSTDDPFNDSSFPSSTN